MRLRTSLTTDRASLAQMHQNYFRFLRQEEYICEDIK